MRLPLRILPWLLLAAMVTRAAQAPEAPDGSQKSEKSEKSAKSEKPEKSDADKSDDDKPADLSLTPSQQEAVGIRIEHPLALTSSLPIEAYGTVLDPAALTAELGRLESSQAAASAAAAEASRTRQLYRDEAQASLKASQASQAQAVEADAQARAAAMTFSMQWGPLALWSPDQRRTLLAALAKGQQLLLRADVPGHHVGTAIERRALVEVDGVSVGARVLGALPRTDPQSQSAGWLLQLEHAPEGFGPGARTLVRLQSATATSGMLVPAAALFYAEDGAYVYRQQSSGGTGSFHYAAVTVKPLGRVGNSWLVDGLARTDQIVVQGAGVLWSLQGISSFSAAEEEHD
jgi:hypothetical protein